MLLLKKKKKKVISHIWAGNIHHSRDPAPSEKTYGGHQLYIRPATTHEATPHTHHTLTPTLVYVSVIIPCSETPSLVTCYHWSFLFFSHCTLSLPSIPLNTFHRFRVVFWLVVSPMPFRLHRSGGPRCLARWWPRGEGGGRFWQGGLILTSSMHIAQGPLSPLMQESEHENRKRL